jgi:sulfocyanin
MNVEMFQKLGSVRLFLFISVFLLISSNSLVFAEDPEGWKSEWMVVDLEKKFVKFIIIGGYDGSNGTFNFNGYSEGELTLIVPLGWKVEMVYTTKSAYKPHSVGIIEDVQPLPEQGGNIVFPGAVTIQFVPGIHTNNSDTLKFTANKIGKYLLFCGVPIHGRGGMWDYFVVSDKVDRPIVQIEKKTKKQ